MSRPKQDPSGMVGDEWQWRERERGGRKKNDQALNPKQVHYSSKIHIPIAPKKKKNKVPILGGSNELARVPNKINGQV